MLACGAAVRAGSCSPHSGARRTLAGAVHDMGAITGPASGGLRAMSWPRLVLPSGALTRAIVETITVREGSHSCWGLEKTFEIARCVHPHNVATS